jgi:hypothetical protein
MNINQEWNSVKRLASNNEFLTYVSLAKLAIYDNGVGKIAVSLESLGECSSPMICLSFWMGSLLRIYACAEVTFKWTASPDFDFIYFNPYFPPLVCTLPAHVLDI